MMQLVVGSHERRSNKLDRARLAAIALACCAGWLATARLDAQPPRTVWSGIYSEAQARRGEDAYKVQCAYCHQPDLTGGFFDNGTGRAPALAGPKAFDSSFVDRWRDQTVAEFIATIAATMPQNKPASLPVETYIDIATFLMSRNGIPAGMADLAADVPTLQGISITAKP
jgi:cytochrome c